jgi:hypothetical protein
MNLTTAVTIGVSVGIALTGYLAKYWNDLTVSRRNDRLDRLNRQLSELYGPLFSLFYVGNAAWRAFALANGGSYELVSMSKAHVLSFNTQSLDEGQRHAWHLWIREVFMPLNRRMVTLIVEKADLIEGHEMPDCLLALCTHVYAYEAVLKQWDEENYAVETSVTPYPAGELGAYLNVVFPQLKHRQVQLLGKL